MQAVEIDRSHPLASALVAMYIPGSPWVGLNDLAGNCPPLIPASAVNGVMASAGPGFASNAASSGFQATAPAILKITTPQTLIWYGDTYGVAFSTNCSVSGILPNNTAAAPYYSRNITVANPSGIELADSVQGFGAQVAYTSVAIGATSLIGTFNGVNQTLYVNGVNVNTVATGGTPAYTATACISIGGDVGTPADFSTFTTVLAAWYNRQLTASEIRWLANEPFCMLRPKARRTYRRAAAFDPWMAHPQLMQIWSD